jgi:hypothetical protein
MRPIAREIQRGVLGEFGEQTGLSLWYVDGR